VRLDYVRADYTRGRIDCFYKLSFLPESESSMLAIHQKQHYFSRGQIASTV